VLILARAGNESLLEAVHGAVCDRRSVAITSSEV
jgi:hypothetical protein